MLEHLRADDPIEGAVCEREVERVALDILADMSNAGWPLQKALAAIYFTGVQDALAITNGEDL